MKIIEYRIVWGGGETEIVTVRASTINEGFASALGIALGRWAGEEPNSDHDIARIEFWMCA